MACSYTVKYLILITTIMCGWAGNLQAQYGTTEGLILLSGEVVDENGKPLKDVHIQNMGNKQVTVTDNSGFFSIFLYKDHNLRFSAVGFRPTYFTTKANSKSSIYQVIKLRSTSVALNEITVTARKEARATEMMIPPEGDPLFSIGYQGEQKEVKPNVGSPISALYNWLGKEGKQNKKLEELLKQDKIKEIAGKRFESEEFWQLTGLVGPELEEFKDFCGMTDLFLATATDYEFLVRVKACYENFNN